MGMKKFSFKIECKGCGLEHEKNLIPLRVISVMWDDEIGLGSEFYKVCTECNWTRAISTLTEEGCLRVKE